MDILVVAATKAEIAPFLSTHAKVDFLITGIGAPAATYHLTRRLHQMDYSYVVQAGIAGSFEQSIPPGTVVIVKEDRFGDLGAMEKGEFSSIHDLKLEDGNVFPFRDGWLQNNNEIVERLKMKQVRAITVNTLTDDDAVVRQMMQKHAAQIESMEGAALHYVCMMENVPHLQLRAISNYVGERDRKKWEIMPATQNLNRKLTWVLDHLIENKQAK